MFEAGSISGISLLFRLFELILKKVRKDSLREELALSLEIPIKNAEHSLENFIFSLYQYFGAGVMGNIFEPSSPKESAQKIVDNIEVSYSAFTHDFKELSKYFDAHMEVFKEVLTPKEVIALEAFVKAFEGDIPDYEFLMNHGTIKSLILKETQRKKTFSKELGGRLNKMMKNNVKFSSLSGTIKSPQIDAQQLIIETMTRIVLEKQFSLE
ncbi:MAG: hypothetical protein Q7U51_07950 [Methanoregula sp.]|nr:hypothetical protein [Methanoregula sp.]